MPEKTAGARVGIKQAAVVGVARAAPAAAPAGQVILQSAKEVAAKTGMSAPRVVMLIPGVPSSLACHALTQFPVSVSPNASTANVAVMKDLALP